MKYSEGCLLDGRYQLKRFIGSGTFGEVWVANDTATDLEVAIKVYVSMDETGYKEFKKEFQISFELNHSNLLHANYLGVNPEDKCPYLVMPFCPDGSVSRHIGSMSEADMWRFIRDVASGLAYLHSMNPPIIHQDIKPDNILILRNGDFVITDFGISKQLRATLRKSANNLNSAGAISYMGPERFSKQYQAVKASDVWSLGASIFELATGELPFCGMGGSLLKQGADMPELPDSYSETLNMVCQACMTKETWNRPTAQQIADFAATREALSALTENLILGYGDLIRIQNNEEGRLAFFTREEADSLSLRFATASLLKSFEIADTMHSDLKLNTGVSVSAALLAIELWSAV
jgi:serine/threonine protein kinase